MTAEPPEATPETPGANWPGGPYVPPPAPPPPPGWPEPVTPGDWSAPGYAPPKRNGVGVASLFVGLLALPFVILVVPGIVIGALALTLGIVGLRRVKRGEATAKGVATVGVTLGTIAVVASIVWAVAIGMLTARDQRRYEDCLRAGTPPQVCVDTYDPSDP